MDLFPRQRRVEYTKQLHISLGNQLMGVIRTNAVYVTLAEGKFFTGGLVDHVQGPFKHQVGFPVIFVPEILSGSLPYAGSGTLMQGRILVGEHDGVYVLVFEGDVRLTLCTTVDVYLEKMFKDDTFKCVVVDLSKTENIDSTSLGLLAKLSIQADKRFSFRPTLISTRRDITRILLSMGFDEVFNIVETPLEHAEQLAELPKLAASEEDMRQRVLDAHRTLMSMNEANRETFHDLVAALETESVDTVRSAAL